ncbi:T7SS effector LXG polymorphic toxin [Bacillus sp. 491mf]|uniref:T7SS effector LXG polymorphic toxin n=1 Tax=Bacillus sp. 491mf TaxID=1761755 RepID=UPI00210E9DC5|nr:T7SS effector LXG polymorphic toxin [Bacillus sp. 491mf]
MDAFMFDAVLQGQTYDSAKTFFAQTFRPLAQGIIYLCEELIRQNNAFPNDFQSQVATTDVIEEEIKEQMRQIDRTKTGIEGISSTLPSTKVMVDMFDAMKRKLQEKLDHLHRFNYTSSSNYDTAIQLAASIARGLAEVQSGKGFSSASGTFSTQELNMDWVAPIQKIAEDKARKADKLDSTVANAKSSDSNQKQAKGSYETFKGTVKWKEGTRLGGEAEGFVLETKNRIGGNDEFSMKALSGKMDINMPFSLGAIKDDLLAGKIIGGKIEASALENSYKAKIPITTPIGVFMKDITITQKFFEGNFASGVDQYTMKLGAELTTNKYEVELNIFHFPKFIPIIGDKDMIAKGELGIGTFGYKLSLGAQTGGYIAPGEGFGLGGFLKFEKPEDKK